LPRRLAKALLIVGYWWDSPPGSGLRRAERNPASANTRPSTLAAEKATATWTAAATGRRAARTALRLLPQPRAPDCDGDCHADPDADAAPMNILAARARSYPGSNITIVETLQPGVNYYRYIASYESDV